MGTSCIRLPVYRKLMAMFVLLSITYPPLVTPGLQLNIYIRFCLETAVDRLSGTCGLGSFQTPELSDDASISFGERGQPLTPNAPGLINPLTFDFAGPWPGAINVHLDIIDFDNVTSDDLINRADVLIPGPPGQSDATTAFSSRVTAPVGSTPQLTLQCRAYRRSNGTGGSRSATYILVGVFGGIFVIVVAVLCVIACYKCCTGPWWAAARGAQDYGINNLMATSCCEDCRHGVLSTCCCCLLGARARE